MYNYHGVKANSRHVGLKIIFDKDLEGELGKL